MSRDEHHVVPDKNGGWNVKRSGSERASVNTDTKKMRLTLQEKLVKIKIQSLLFIIKTAKLHVLIATAKILARQRIRNSFTES